MPVCTQTMLSPPQGSVGTRAAVGGAAARRRWNLVKHIVLPESKQRCTWQRRSATTKEVRKSPWLSNTPHCRKSLSMGFWEDILQLVTEAETTWHNNWNGCQRENLLSCVLFNLFSLFCFQDYNPKKSLVLGHLVLLKGRFFSVLLWGTLALFQRWNMRCF